MFNLKNYKESDRERERFRRKEQNAQRLEKQFREEEKNWEKREEEKENQRRRNKVLAEAREKRKESLIERDLNYESDDEKEKIKKNPKKYQERHKMRLIEQENDELMRRKEHPERYKQPSPERPNVTDLVPIIDANEQQIKLHQDEEEEKPKAEVIVQEYKVSESNETPAASSKNIIDLKIQPKKKLESKMSLAYHDHDEDMNNMDPYHKTQRVNMDIDEETEMAFKQISQELNLQREYEEKAEKMKEKVSELASSATDKSKKIIEIHKSIVEAIPKDKETLYKFPINWNILIKVKFNLFKNSLERYY